MFSIAFGRNLDAHAPADPQPAVLANATAAAIMTLRAPVDTIDKSHQCLQGKECYVGSLLMTTVACSIALVLAIWAGWWDYRQVGRIERRPRRSTDED